MTQTDNWLDNLKPGDEVFVVGSYDVARETVERVTATQVVLRNCLSRYRRSDGKMIGAISFVPPVLEPITDEKAMRLWIGEEMQAVISHLKRLSSRCKHTDRMRDALALLREAMDLLAESDGDE